MKNRFLTRLPLRSIVATALVLVLSACGDSPNTPAADAHVGTYNLITVNGDPLPFHLGVFEGFTFHLLAGRITLNADGTASDLYTYRATQDTFVIEDSEADAGTYTRSGNVVVITWSGGFQETYTYDGNQLTITEEGFVGVYRK